jgi:2-oxoisovalerate dehydrogenase E1 component
LNTFRLGPHSKGDDDRLPEELKSWQERDPLLALSRRIPEDERNSIDVKLATEIHACVEEATMAAWPEESVEELTALAPTSAGRDPVMRTGTLAPRVVESLNQALHDLMDSDPSVYVIGEDIVDPYGGAFKVTKGLSVKFPDRVWATPISEAGFVGMASGMAMAGMSPIVELMFGDFLALAADQIVNSLGKLHFLSRGKAKTNVVIRTPMGGGRGYGATHSQSLEKMFLGTPGVKLVAVSTVLDPGALLYNAVMHDPNPVLFVENKLLYPERVQQSADGWIDDFELKVTGGLYPTATLNVAGGDVPDVTVISYGRTALMAMEAAKAIFIDREIVAEVVVVSQLSPLSMEGLSESAARSGRVLVLEEGTLEAGWASEVIARLVEDGFRGHAKRIGALACPIPSSRPLENLVIPTVESIRTGLENLLLA